MVWQKSQINAAATTFPYCQCNQACVFSVLLAINIYTFFKKNYQKQSNFLKSFTVCVKGFLYSSQDKQKPVPLYISLLMLSRDEGIRIECRVTLSKMEFSSYTYNNAHTSTRTSSIIKAGNCIKIRS